MGPIVLRTVSKQLAMLERSIRSIRAGVDKIIAEQALDGKILEMEVEIDNGLTKLLTSPVSMPPTRIEPYQKFAPGICCGHSVKRGNFAIVETATLSTESDTPNHSGACCLIVHPTFNADEPADWMTIEVNIDIEQLKKLDSLDTKLLLMFQVSNGFALPNFALQTRLFYGSEVKDHSYRKFPSLPYPIELSYVLDTSRMNEMELAKATHAMLLIHLPIDTRCEYRCIISYASMLGTVIG